MASFRFHLAMNTLAVGYVIPAIRAYSRLAPIRQCSCRAYQKKGVPQDMAHLSLTSILSNLKQKTYLESVNSKAVRLHLNIQYITIDLGI